MDVKIQQKFQVTQDSKVMANIASWVPNTRNYKGHQNHYLHRVYLYWHGKLMLVKILIDKRQTQVILMHKLDELKYLMLNVKG